MPITAPSPESFWRRTCQSKRDLKAGIFDEVLILDDKRAPWLGRALRSGKAEECGRLRCRHVGVQCQAVPASEATE